MSIRLAITSGEPAGIGPDLCLQISQQDHGCELVVIADPDLLKARAQQLGLEVSIRLFDKTASVQPSKAGEICVYPVALARSEEHTSELQSRPHLVCRLLLEKKKKNSVVLLQKEKSRSPTQLHHLILPTAATCQHPVCRHISDPFRTPLACAITATHHTKSSV